MNLVIPYSVKTGVYLKITLVINVKLQIVGVFDITVTIFFLKVVKHAS